MMKDDKIQQLFDNYADELPQQNNLCSRAAQAMAQKAERKKTTASFWKKLTGILAASFVLVFFVGFVLGVVIPSNGNKNDHNQPSNEPTARVDVYAAKDVTTFVVNKPTSTKLSGELTAAQIIDLDNIDFGDGVSVIGVRYFAEYLADGQLASVTAVWRVYVEQSFVDITIVAEANGLLALSREQAYGYFEHGMQRWHTTQNGEEVTIGYLRATDFHYYVSAACSNNYASSLAVDCVVDGLKAQVA